MCCNQNRFETVRWRSGSRPPAPWGPVAAAFREREAEAPPERAEGAATWPPAAERRLGRERACPEEAEPRRARPVVEGAVSALAGAVSESPTGAGALRGRPVPAFPWERKEAAPWGWKTAPEPGAQSMAAGERPAAWEEWFGPAPAFRNGAWTGAVSAVWPPPVSPPVSTGAPRPWKRHHRFLSRVELRGPGRLPPPAFEPPSS